MSRRERKSDRQSWAPSVIAEARKLLGQGKSKRSVAKYLGIPESTLRRLLQKNVCPTKLGRYDTTFSIEVENGFRDYLKRLDEMFFGMTTKDLRALAYEFAEKHHIPHRFNRETKTAGKEWLRSFLKRHPDLSIRQPTSTSIARAAGFNRPQCERFYINMSAVLDKYNFPPHRIYNMDETGISTVPNRPPKVLTTKGKRAVNKISSAERGTNVTVVNAVSATGHYVPPVFIFGRKRMKAELLDGAPAGSTGMTSDSSFINADLFIDWLSHFKDHTKPTENDPILLVLDNHSSHCSIKAVDFYRENNIVALTLPPHSSHKMQPLDRGFHSVLKKYYAGECEKWLRSHPGRAITVFQMTSIFTPAFNRAATIACAAESFRVTGIWPWNPDVFTDADFMASTVTEQEDPNDNVENTAETINQAIVTATTSQVSQSAGTEIQIVCETDTTAARHGLLEATEANMKCSQDASVTEKIINISPFPKSQTKRCGNRKRMKSEIISSSPYKCQLENANKQKAKPKLKLPKKSFKVPKKTQTKNVWTCVGCQEIYKEPIREDWIECSVCREWWHEKCTGYLGFGEFKCDVCLQ